MHVKFRKIVIRGVQETSNSCTRLELKGKLIKEMELKRKGKKKKELK